MPGPKGTATVMKEWKAGTLNSGSEKGPKVTNQKQAIAISLSEERALGHKVPKKKGKKSSKPKDMWD
jgi:hypothetical protein